MKGYVRTDKLHGFRAEVLETVHNNRAMSIGALEGALGRPRGVTATAVNWNVRQGYLHRVYCNKNGWRFTVTSAGRKALGVTKT